MSKQSGNWCETLLHGVVLVVGPFNYPFQLTVSVVAGGALRAVLGPAPSSSHRKTVPVFP